MYTLRLKVKLNPVYVDLTGLHPYERYFIHIIGYKTTSKAKKKATALICFEGPMPSEVASANELRQKAMDSHRER